MISRRLRQCSGLLVVLCGLGVPRSADCGVIYDVSVDTTAIQGTSGFMDFQYNPGGVGTLPSAAGITSFATDGTRLSLNTTDGDVTGSLVPGPLTINNTFALNDLLENVTFGTSVTFVLTLTGPGVDSPDATLPGSSFGFNLFDSSFTPLLTIDPAGTALTINLNSDGSTGAVTFASDSSGNAPVAEAVVASSSSVPEPAAWLLLLSGLSGIGGVRVARKLLP